jgi:hypothetical protein
MKRITLAAIALIVGALVVAGCGGSSGGGSTETSTTTASASGSGGSTKAGGMVEISAEAKACLKEKGVELPEFKGGEGGPPTGSSAAGGEPPEGGEMPEGAEGGPPSGGAPGGEKMEEQKEAFEECGVEIGGGFAGGPGGAGKPNTNSAAFKKQVKEYAACVRKNGYELAEPNFSGEGPVFEKAESESAEFKQASESCQSLLGGPQGSQSG